MLDLGHVCQKGELDAEHVVFRVDATVRGGDTHAEVSHVVDPAVDVLHRAADAVQLGEDHEVDQAGLDVSRHPVQLVTVCKFPRHSPVAVDIDDGVRRVLELVADPRSGSLILHVQAVAVELAGRGNTQVDGYAHRLALAWQCLGLHDPPISGTHEAPGRVAGGFGRVCKCSQVSAF